MSRHEPKKRGGSNGPNGRAKPPILRTSGRGKKKSAAPLEETPRDGASVPEKTGAVGLARSKPRVYRLPQSRGPPRQQPRGSSSPFAEGLPDYARNAAIQVSEAYYGQCVGRNGISGGGTKRTLLPLGVIFWPVTQVECKHCRTIRKI